MDWSQRHMTFGGQGFQWWPTEWVSNIASVRDCYWKTIKLSAWQYENCKHAMIDIGVIANNNPNPTLSFRQTNHQSDAEII